MATKGGAGQKGSGSGNSGRGESLGGRNGAGKPGGGSAGGTSSRGTSTQASRNQMNLSNIGAGPTGVSAAGSPTSSTGQIGKGTTSGNGGVLDSPPNHLEYSPLYDITDYDRLLQALGMAGSVATGGILSGLGGLAMSEMGLGPFGDMTAPRGWTKDPSKGASADARGTPYIAPNGMTVYVDPTTGTPTIDTSSFTSDNIFNALNRQMGGNELYYLQQQGLAPLDVTGDMWNASENIDPRVTDLKSKWDPVFQREFDRIKGTVPTGVIPDNGQFADQNAYNTALQQIAALFPSTFGQQALTAEQDRRRNQYKTNVGGLGLENQISGALGDTSDDAIIQSIYDSQYNPARQQVENAYRRGSLNQSGLNYALNKLSEQGQAGMSQLQETGANKRAALTGSLNDYVKSIYDKSQQYTLQDPDFDPSSMVTEFGNRLNTATGGLEGSLKDQVPNIFDVSSVLQGAGTVQGATSRGAGGLLDTLAGREYQKRQSSRGLGTTGAF